jgi:hypothetical protein
MTPTSRPRDAALVVAHCHEDLGWLAGVRRDLYPEVVVVSKALREAPPPGCTRLLHQPVNEGYEASAYLEYIVREYDRLREYTLFLHGHRVSWHHAGDADELANSVAFRRRYASVNLPHLVIQDAQRHVLEEYRGPAAEFYERVRRIAGAPAAPAEQRRRRVRQAAQFYAHRDAIRARPRAVYAALLRELLATPDTKQGAIMLEFLWCYLLTGHDDELAWEATPVG